MAAFLQKLVRKQQLSSATLITNLNKRILSSSSPLLNLKPEPTVAPIPFFNGLPGITDDTNPHPRSSTFYPTFAFESFLNPISQIGFIQHVVPEEDTVTGDDDRGMWADSVKKKRKKKMNKHKLKKLRKRLRRKT